GKRELCTGRFACSLQSTTERGFQLAHRSGSRDGPAEHTDRSRGKGGWRCSNNSHWRLNYLDQRRLHLPRLNFARSYWLLFIVGKRSACPTTINTCDEP